MQSLVVSVPDLALGSTDTEKRCWVVLSRTLQCIAWCYGVNLLSRAETALVLPPRSDGIVESEPTSISQSSKSKQCDLIDLSESIYAPFEVVNDSRLALHSRSTHTNQVTIFAEPSSSSLPPVEHSPAFYTFPNTPNDSNLTPPESIQDYSGESMMNPTKSPTKLA